MKISEGGPFERMDHAQLIQGFSDQTKDLGGRCPFSCFGC